jgi:hypothetical protein
MIQQRRAELMQSGERELHLRLNACRAGDSAVGRALQQVLQQRRLADAGLTTKDEHSALASLRVCHEPI